jgi:hypothetical protein
MEVVERDPQRLPNARAHQEFGERLEQIVAIVIRVSPRGAGAALETAFQLRDEPCEILGFRSCEFTHGFFAPKVMERPEDLLPRPEWRHTLVVIATALEREETTRHGFGRGLLGEPRLSDTAFAGKEADPSAPRACLA